MAAPKSKSWPQHRAGQIMADSARTNFALRQLNEQLEHVYPLVSVMHSRVTSEVEDEIDLPLVHVLDIAMQLAGDREALRALEDELGYSADKPVPRADESPRACD